MLFLRPMKRFLLLVVLYTICATAFAHDTLKQEKASFHFQQTIITQTKPAFHALYSGQNSLDNLSETQSSITTTFFGDMRLWKGFDVVFNPELSGGAGLGKTLGVAGFPNGETFRVGSASPAIYIARFYVRKNFEWGKEKDTIESDANQLAGT